MSALVTLIRYAHDHWQDNVIASAIWAIPGFFWGRHHVKRFHAKIDKVHKHLDIK